MRKHPLAKCEECPLAQHPCAPSLIPAGKPKFALVSRSPGYHEAMSGKPFSGPSGRVLDHLLAQNGVKRAEGLVTNVVLCSLKEGAKDVPKEAIAACNPRLQEELKGIDLVIAAGAEAVNSLVGRGAIDKFRGHRHVRNGRALVATNNPALVLRDDSTFPNLVKDFKRAFHPLPPPILPKVVIVDEPSRASDLLTRLADGSNLLFAADIETRRGVRNSGELVTIQFSHSGDEAFVFGESACGDETFRELLKTFLEDARFRFIWHNGLYDVKFLRRHYGINTRADEDTLLLSYVLDERSGGGEESGKFVGRIHSLDYLLADELGWPDYETEAVKHFKRTGEIPNDKARAELYEYAGYDAAGTKQLYNLLQPRADADDVLRPYEYLLLRATPVIIDMMLAGMPYDVNAAADVIERETRPEMERLVIEMQKIELINPGSPKQLAALFYDKWRIGHEMRRRPDMERSTDAAALKEILEDRFTIPVQYEKLRPKIIKFVEQLARWKKLQKQASTYLHPLIERAEQDEESRVYTDLLLHGTTSGRPSSRNPNLLNITRTKEGLPDIRRLFKASLGRLIVQADYSQAELRSIAALSGDTTLTTVYTKNEDLHALAAARFYGPNFTSEERSKAKNMNFGVAYRQSAATFQEKHGIPEKEAQKFIDWWWTQFKGVAEWEKDVERKIRKEGTLVSPFGRKRRFHLLTQENMQAAFREGINFYPQSTAADFTLCSLIIMHDELDATRVELCLTVYDSILGNCEEGYVDEYKVITKQIMESRPKDELGWTIPFEVDIGAGPNWAEAK